MNFCKQIIIYIKSIKKNKIINFIRIINFMIFGKKSFIYFFAFDRFVAFSIFYAKVYIYIFILYLCVCLCVYLLLRKKKSHFPILYEKYLFLHFQMADDIKYSWIYFFFCYLSFILCHNNMVGLQSKWISSIGSHLFTDKLKRVGYRIYVNQS